MEGSDSGRAGKAYKDIIIIINLLNNLYFILILLNNLLNYNNEHKLGFICF